MAGFVDQYHLTLRYVAMTFADQQPLLRIVLPALDPRLREDDSKNTVLPAHSEPLPFPLRHPLLQLLPCVTPATKI